MGCPQKLTLLEKYQQEVCEFAQSVSELREYTATIPFVEYMLLLKLTRHKLMTCQAAQRRLGQHILEHGC